jgi:glycine oxidase
MAMSGENRADLIVVGGGVIGLAAAWRAAEAGLTVILLDAGELGGQSSRAAAGILGPLAESSADEPFTALLWAALQRFPSWVDALRARQPIDPELALDGIVRLVAPEEADALRSSLAWRQRYDPAVAVVDPEVPDFAYGIWSPHEGQIYGPRYLRALAGAARAAGVSIRIGVPALGFQTKADRITGVRTPAGTVTGAWTLVAAGVWTDHVLEPLHVNLGVFPVRGQVMAARAPSRPFAPVRFGAHGYVAPKANGLVIIGATEDQAGFDSRVTVAGLEGLLARARRLAPDLMTLPWERAWAGLRPATADGRPVIGPVPGCDGLYVAAGHYRNGLLLSALTADLVLHDIAGTPLPSGVDPGPYRLRR